ncbi:MAG: NADH-quinone oxidoreductase subunit C [Candidatus Sericytochromatia bacterium]|nr:NADH-quinone oxidoreductase subunit C [Candidatus Sericytochromatia bacterium]
MVEIIKDLDTVKKSVEMFEGVQDSGLDANGIPMLTVPADKLVELVRFLRDEKKYDYFNSLTAAEDDNFYISIYNIYAMLDYSKRRITIKVNSPKENPVVPSLVSLYPAANWFERESYDLMGIIYSNHPDLTRILTTDDWIGHTLRRDYKIVEPESYTNILKAIPDVHVQEGLDRSDIYKGLK